MCEYYSKFAVILTLSSTTHTAMHRLGTCALKVPAYPRAPPILTSIGDNRANALTEGGPCPRESFAPDKR
jgi:hypothetical protein